jgi:hypothetical protein
MAKVLSHSRLSGKRGSSKQNLAYPTLMQVLLEKTLPPWDYSSFEKFCIKQQNIEVLHFWKAIHHWQDESDAGRTVEAAKKIFQKFLMDDSKQLINLPGKLFSELNEKYARLDTLGHKELKYLFNSAQQEMFELMRTGIYKYFVRDVILHENLIFAEDMARWWKD